MRRLLLTVLALSLSALLAPAAQAKGISKVAACGASGCQDATPRRQHDTALLEGGPQIATPQRKARFFELRITIGAPDSPEARAQVLYVPALSAMRVHWPNQLAQWMHVGAHPRAALERAVGGLVPFAASKLELSDGSETYTVPKARVVEVVPAPRPSASGSDDDWLGWAAGGSALVLLLGGFWALLRRRRARPGLHPAG